MHMFVTMTAEEFRVDSHPAWDRAGQFVAFNGFFDRARAVYIADVSSLVNIIG